MRNNSGGMMDGVAWVFMGMRLAHGVCLMFNIHEAICCVFLEWMLDELCLVSVYF